MNQGSRGRPLAAISASVPLALAPSRRCSLPPSPKAPQFACGHWSHVTNAVTNGRKPNPKLSRWSKSVSSRLSIYVKCTIQGSVLPRRTHSVHSHAQKWPECLSQITQGVCKSAQCWRHVDPAQPPSAAHCRWRWLMADWMARSSHSESEESKVNRVRARTHQCGGSLPRPHWHNRRHTQVGVKVAVLDVLGIRIVQFVAGTHAPLLRLPYLVAYRR